MNALIPVVRHENQVLQNTAHVFYTGSDAVKKGQGLCYDHDSGTATAMDNDRISNVEKPSPSNGNNMYFAGVALRSYAAKSTGQMIEIVLPGSPAEVLVGRNTVLNTGRLTCSATAADKGFFTFQGLPGRGSVIPLQTNASAIKFSSLDGTAITDSSTAKQITKTGIGTASAVGDRVFITGCLTPGACQETTVASIVDADNITVTDSGSVLTTSDDVCVYVIDADTDPLVWCWLEDGQESGLQHMSTPVDNAAASPAPMVGGTTVFFGGFTIGTGDSTATLADGTKIGEKKAFYCTGTLTTNDMKVTVTTGLQMDGSTTLASVEFDAANEFALLEFGLSKWQLQILSGATPA